MDQPKLERLLRLMKLLTANTTYNVDQLAERLQMSRRTSATSRSWCTSPRRRP